MAETHSKLRNTPPLENLLNHRTFLCCLESFFVVEQTILARICPQTWLEFRVAVWKFRVGNWRKSDWIRDTKVRLCVQFGLSIIFVFENIFFVIQRWKERIFSFFKDYKNSTPFLYVPIFVYTHTHIYL